MRVAANILVGLVALAHFYFLALEMFFWTKPLGLRTFGMTQDFANSTAVLAANQGLYNGFLAAGLLWGLLDARRGFALKVFFLLCIIVAGVYGGLTAKMTILYVQALPGLVALVFVLLAGGGPIRR
jgi:putative membrane protein